MHYAKIGASFVYEELISSESSKLDNVVLTEAIGEFKPAMQAFKEWLAAQEKGDTSAILLAGKCVVAHVKQYVAQVAIAQGVLA